MKITYTNSECVCPNPGSFVDDILYGHPNIGDDPGQFCNTTRPVTDNNVECDQPPICSQTSVQTPTQEGSVNIAATQGKNNSAKDIHFIFFQVMD